jgi:hypothetical protein
VPDSVCILGTAKVGAIRHAEIAASREGVFMNFSVFSNYDLTARRGSAVEGLDRAETTV